MKKQIGENIAKFKGLFVVAFLLLAFTTPKRYTIELSEQQVNLLMYALDKSDAEHNSVIKPLFTEISKQIAAQADTTKRK